MASLATVNTTLNPPDSSRNGDEQTPTTPKPSSSFSHAALIDATNEEPSTPTVNSFGGVTGQKPLPDDLPIQTNTQDQPKTPEESLKRGASRRSSMSQFSGEQDIEMAEGDQNNDMDDDGSDNDSVTSDSQRPSKKKKGQRFFCTEFPPCQLSFTRSEHLARHIRKHTGERPFQCHCSRRFSRLDNLRQHAQTVHVNEEIPGDSLAATSTRFQRQIRTDRVRPPTNRSRASTLGSTGGHSRGHSRNLSTSSIGSTASSVGTQEETRKRPPPLAMANESSTRARLSLDTYNNATGGPNQQQYAYYNQSPTGYSTPNSASFSTGAGSPRFQSAMASPVSTISRSSFYNGARRRLSVPSTNNPFQSPNMNTYPPPMYFNGAPMANPGVMSQNSSVFASPTNSNFSHSRRESEAELEYRRRTWHPGTYTSFSQRPATSGLSYHQTPDDQHPAMSDQRAASQVTRLPGIESFDHAPPSNSRQQSSPMMIDSSPRMPSSGRQSDAGLHQNLTRLDITASNAPIDPQLQAMQPQGYVAQQPTTVAPHHVQPHPSSMPEPPVTPRRNKRQAWYGGPVVAGGQRPSPEDSGSSDGVPTPGTSQGNEFHPVIISANGATESYPPGTLAADEQKVYYTNAPKPEPLRADSGYQAFLTNNAGHVQQTYALQSGHDPRLAATYRQPPNNDMGRLEALVAVATSENRAVER